ncbi:hypothetical protein Y032_0015g2585 [Ancylostoma ceylanicum]|uniref:Reverse transcriptase domain-containing protein n=1 Tax=Ancylostoma ceylanicum TaxID=53326 RepID=A0A016V8G3_9BILA|nr:hypothetical protein Y032_0015g2585 [Ancylostoma ceylanicum]
MASRSVSTLQKNAGNTNAKKRISADLTSDEIAAALQQLHGDKKTPKNISPLKFVIRKLNCDVVIITETWLNGSCDLTPILGDLCDDFNYVRCDRIQKKGGGVVILIKRYIAFETKWLEAVPDAYEVLCCDLKLLRSTVRITGIYRTPSCNLSNTIKLSNVISDLSSLEGHHVVSGDFNLPDIDWSEGIPTSTTTISKHFIDMCQSCKLHQYVCTPTRGGHILDLVLSNYKDSVKNINVNSPVGSSDHCSLSYTITASVDPPTYRLRRAYNKANYDSICQYLCLLDWRTLLECYSCSNEKYEFFLSALQYCIENFVPIEKYPVSYGNLPPNLARLFDLKEKAWVKSQSNPSQENVDYFKLLRSKFDRLLRKYNSYIERKLLQSSSKSSLYRLLNSKLKRSLHIPTLKDDDGTTAIADDAKASILAKHFQKSFSDNSSDVKWSTVEIPCTSKDSSVWFYKEEIYEILSKLPLSYSVTPDDVPPYFIRKVAIAIAYPLEHIFNFSFMHGDVPDRWKHAFVTPIPKKAPFCLVSNYRPISITSVFARTFEKILKSAILKHLETNNILPEEQFGFRAGRSTETLMLSTLEDWTDTLDQGNNIDVVYFDFAKAFDKVPSAELIYKLGLIGLHPRLIKWIKNFISGRSFQVKVNECFSEICPVTSGVPQGGVLSPILFIIYTREIPGLIYRYNVSCKMFADDIKIYKNVLDSADHVTLQSAIDAIYDWIYAKYETQLR